MNFYSIIVIVLSIIFYSQFIIYYTYIFFSFFVSEKPPWGDDNKICIVLYCIVNEGKSSFAISYRSNDKMP